MPSQEPPLIDMSNDLFMGVDHGHVAHLTRAFDIMADKLGGVSNSTAMWALAILVAKIMAATAMDTDLLDITGKRFGTMLKTAYPAMVAALEHAQREQEGRQPFDA